MRHNLFSIALFHFLTILLMAESSVCRAEVRLPRVISDRMVLQRDLAIPIWGWALPGEEVTVTLGQTKPATTTADAAGKWRVDLPAMKAGGPFTLTITGKNTITIQDVAVGEVWICFGQSNMQWKFSQSSTFKQDALKANDPLLRLSTFLASPNTYPQTDVNMSWSASNVGSASGTSAVAYYFGKYLREKLDVPVGILHSSAGAIPIEAWTPASGCLMVPSQTKIVRLVDQVRTDFQKEREKVLEPWIIKAREAVSTEQPLPPPPNVSDLIVQRGWMPTTLYNSSIHPLIPYGIRGAVMYQGEANNGQGMEYVEKMQALIGGWRKAWGQGDFPFLYVQLAPWAKYPEGNLEGIWEAQRLSLSIPNTGMVVTTDLVPDLNDIHPPRKKEVGERLALWALAKTYGQDKLVHSGPLFKSAKVEEGKIRVSFDHVGSGLMARNEKPLDSFQIGNADGFVPAQAKIDGDTVLVWSDDVPKPLYVRFGWKNTAQPNLVNKEGLPASPFRSDCGAGKYNAGTRFVNVKRVSISKEYIKGTIRYTLDGTTPTEQSAEHTVPIEIQKTTTISHRLFAADGRSSATAKQTYTKVDAVKHEGMTLAPGLDFEYYIGRWTTLPAYDSLKPDHTGSIDALDPPIFGENFMCAHRIKGYIDIPTTGMYTFSTKAHGGVHIYINGKLIVDDEGFHAPVEKVGIPVQLTAGKHEIKVLYHEGGGFPNLIMQYEGPGMAKQVLPNAAYFRKE